MFTKDEILEIVTKYAERKKSAVPLMKKFSSKELENLRAKPSDYRPGRYEKQLSFEDFMPMPKYDETLIIKMNMNAKPEDFTYWHRIFVEQRKKGVIVLPPDFEVVGYVPSDAYLKVTNDADMFVDNFLKNNK